MPHEYLLQIQEYLNIVYMINFLLFNSNNALYNSYLVISEDLLPFLWVPLRVFPKKRRVIISLQRSYLQYVL